MTKTRLKKAFDKKDFNAAASTLKITCWYLVNVLFFKSSLLPFSCLLVLVLRGFGAKIGRDVRIKPGIYIRYPWKLSIGDHSWLADCYIDNLAEVLIGKHVCISQQAMLQTGNHNYRRSSFDLMIQSIVLEDGVWIGARATVCPGVTAHSHSVLLAGAVGTKNMKAYTIYTGNPAVQIKDREITSNG